VFQPVPALHRQPVPAADRRRVPKGCVSRAAIRLVRASVIMRDQMMSNVTILQVTAGG